jgi:hypothetical protein
MVRWLFFHVQNFEVTLAHDPARSNFNQQKKQTFPKQITATQKKHLMISFPSGFGAVKDPCQAPRANSPALQCKSRLLCKFARLTVYFDASGHQHLFTATTRGPSQRLHYHALECTDAAH